VTSEPAAGNDDVDHLWVDWDEYHLMIEQLALKVHDAGWDFDHVLCLARGGLRIGDVLSRVFDRPLAILSTSSYRAGAGTQQGTLDIAANITMTAATLSGRLLLIDDLVDSGVTLDEVVKALKQRYPTLSEIRSAVLWQKPRSIFTPDYVVSKLSANPWIHQPFEAYDGAGIDALLTRHQPR
jgi:hypoxanthine phosphoribosyltransferase